MQSMTALVIPSAHNQTLTIAPVAVPHIAANELLVEVKAVGWASMILTFCPRR